MTSSFIVDKTECSTFKTIFLVGTTQYLQDWLQSMLNAAARLVYSRRTSEHTTQLPQANPVPAVRSGISLCARHSTGVSGWQPAADIRGGCSSLSALCRLSNNAGAINPSINSWWPRISCGCSAGMEQSATTDQGRLLATEISAGDQVSFFPEVIWLMEVWRCLCWLTEKL